MKAQTITKEYPACRDGMYEYEKHSFEGSLYVIPFLGHTIKITSGELHSYQEWLQYEDEWGEPLSSPVLVEEESRHCWSYPVSIDGEPYLPWLVSAALTSNGSEECWLARHSQSEVIAELIRLKSVFEGAGYSALKHEVNELVNPTPVSEIDSQGRQPYLFY